MQKTPTKIVAGNWKMHGSLEMLAEYVSVLARVLSSQRSKATDRAMVVLFPPIGYLVPLSEQLRVCGLQDQIVIGAQDLHPESQGAFTGDMSGAMLRDLGARWVLVGHSERRQYHAEDDQLPWIVATITLAPEHSHTLPASPANHAFSSCRRQSSWVFCAFSSTACAGARILATHWLRNKGDISLPGQPVQPTCGRRSQPQPDHHLQP